MSFLKALFGLEMSDSERETFKRLRVSLPAANFRPSQLAISPMNSGLIALSLR